MDKLLKVIIVCTMQIVMRGLASMISVNKSESNSTALLSAIFHFVHSFVF